MTLSRTPEPPPRDAAEDAAFYAEMDHSEVNHAFVDDLMAGGVVGTRIVDAGCGPAEITVLLAGKLGQRAAEVGCYDWQIMAVDHEVEMLELARLEIEMAGWIEHVFLERADICQLDSFDDGMADTVISNTVIHHLDCPVDGLTELARITGPGGRLFVRDLARPESNAAVEALVALHAENETSYGQQLLRQSLHAAINLDEVREALRGLGVDPGCVQMTSDRHWTIDWTCPSDESE